MDSNVFVCYSSKDKKEVDSLVVEAQKGDYEGLWVSHINGVPTARNDEEYIKDKIINSNGAIIFLSNNFLNSDFINRVELPLIIEQQKSRKEFNVAILLLEECDYRKIDYFNNRQFINSNSTVLSKTTSSQQSLILKEALAKFTKTYAFEQKFTKKELKKKNIYNVILLFCIFMALFLTIRDRLDSSDSKSTELTNDTMPVKGESVYIEYLDAKITNENVGDVMLFSDYDFLNQANWVCSLLSKGVQHYFLYDGLWFLVAENLTKYNAGENMTGDQMWGAVYYIFHGANNYLCDLTVNTDKLESKFNFHKNLTSENYEWRSDLFNTQFKDGYLTKLFELLDNSDPPLSLLGYFDSQDEFYDLMIMGCETILPKEPMDYLDYVQGRFSEAKNLEDQNIIWDFEEIVLFSVPTWFCPDQIEKGNRLSTYIYLVDFKY